MTLSISGTLWLFLGAIFCPIRLASVHDHWKCSQTAWEGAWATFVCHPATSTVPEDHLTRRAGGWQHSTSPARTHSTPVHPPEEGINWADTALHHEKLLLCRGILTALRPALGLMNRVEDLALQNKFHITKYISVFYSCSHSSFL